MSHAVDLRTDFNNRLRRFVSQFLHHAGEEGYNAAELDGEVVLTFRNGQLRSIAFEPPAGTVVNYTRWTDGEGREATVTAPEGWTAVNHDAEDRSNT